MEFALEPYPMFSTIEKMPRCRWCNREPEFTPTVATRNVCEHCGAMADPVVNLSAPGDGFPRLQFYLNPDGSLFCEVTKKDNSTARYTLDLAKLKQSGAYFEAPMPLNGRQIDKGL